MTNSSSKETAESTYTGLPTFKILLWLSMVSMVMMFAGLTSGYIVRQAEGNWLVFELPRIFYLSTVFIVLSSISMQWAFNSVKKDNLKQLRTGLIITLGLGLAFCFTQFTAWSELVNLGIFFTGNPSGSFLYVLTGLHLAHLVGGIIYLMIITARSLQDRYNSSRFLPVELCTIFWHFLDGLWVYLFVFLLFIR
jgi:cytochrome c oxidase subunit III